MAAKKAAAATKAAPAKKSTPAKQAVTAAATPTNKAASVKAAQAKRRTPAKDGFSPEEALRRRAEEAEHIVEYVDRTTLAGSEEDVTGELSTADQHPADTSDMTFQRELDLTVRNIAEQRRAEIEEAMARQRAGTYGICADCGQPIAPERLRARPEATLCIECARAKEHAAHLA